jgi:ABC-type antimicrobial peptide transport system permease subunit
MSLIGILVALIVVGILLWAINKVLGVVPIPEPFKTIIWVVVVVIAVLLFLQISGLYNLGSLNLR